MANKNYMNQEDILLETYITELDASGMGIGYTESEKVSVPFVLPGEAVIVDKSKSKRFKKFFLREVLSSSSSRVKPLCKHFTQCGGCLLQHMSTQLYQDFKKELITKHLVHYKLDPFALEDIIYLPQQVRRRVNLDIVKKNDQLFLGFHRFQSHQIINIEECHTMTQDMIHAILQMKDVLNEILNSFDKAKLWLLDTSVGVDVLLEIQGKSELEEESRIKLYQIAENLNLCRFTFRFRKVRDIIYQHKEPVLLFDGIPVPVDPMCFVQASSDSDRIFADFIHNVCENIDGTCAIDLFCGRGTLTIPLSKKFQVVGYEGETQAIETLQQVSKDNDLRIQAEVRDLFNNPLHANELANYDVISINPPRAGALSQVQHIAASQAKNVIYISCNAETFARDCAILCNHGFKIQKLIGLDQFKWSPHIEVLGYLSR